MLSDPRKTRKDKKVSHRQKGKANKVTKIVETTTLAPIDAKGVKPQKGTKVCGKKNATHKRRLRPGLIIISKKGENVSRIRRPQKGDLMLQLKKFPGKIVENSLSKVEKYLGEEAQVRARKQEIVIQCEDFDEITTKEDIHDALEKQLGPLGL